MRDPRRNSTPTEEIRGLLLVRRPSASHDPIGSTRSRRSQTGQSQGLDASGRCNKPMHDPWNHFSQESQHTKNAIHDPFLFRTILPRFMIPSRHGHPSTSLSFSSESFRKNTIPLICRFTTASSSSSSPFFFFFLESGCVRSM